MTRNVRMLLGVHTSAPERRVLEMPHYESLSSVPGRLGRFRALLASVIFDTVLVLCGVVCWMLLRHR
jgi:hypothetical protein